jgi:integrase
LGLRWADVDLDARLVRVRAQIQRIDGVWRWKEPKTRSSRRQISIPLQVADILRQHRVRQHEERLFVGPVWKDLDLVFCNQAGGPLFARNLIRSFTALLVKGALPRIRFHDLRHTAATLLLSARVNPKVVSEMLGHASVSITLDIYSHVLPDMQHDAAEAMGKILYGWAQKDTNCCQNCCQEGSETEKRLQAQQPETASIQALLGAGGTGIEPATCGFGDRCSA